MRAVGASPEAMDLVKLSNMKKKTKIWIAVILSTVVITNLPPVNYFLQESYSYQNKDGSFSYTEQPGKGLDYEVGKIRFDRFKERNPNKDQTLYRTFTLKPWRFWEWWQMVSHSERFRLPLYPLS